MGKDLYIEGYTAWFNWYDNKEEGERNLEYLCRPDVAYTEYKYLLPAWDSANAIGSFESNRLILKEV